MNNQTLEKLRQMRLFGMHDAFKTSLENTIKEDDPGPVRIAPGSQ